MVLYGIANVFILRVSLLIYFLKWNGDCLILILIYLKILLVLFLKIGFLTAFDLLSRITLLKYNIHGVSPSPSIRRSWRIWNFQICSTSGYTGSRLCYLNRCCKWNALLSLNLINSIILRIFRNKVSPFSPQGFREKRG